MRVVPAIAVLLPLLVSPASSQHASTNEWIPTDDRWRLVASLEGVVAYVDTRSIVRQGDRVRAWALIGHARIQDPELVRGDNLRSLEEHDCVERRLRTLQGTHFIGNTPAGRSSFGPTRWEFAIPGSLAERRLEFVCRRVE
jgi:hypothetical protein